MNLEQRPLLLFIHLYFSFFSFLHHNGSLSLMPSLLLLLLLLLLWLLLLLLFSFFSSLSFMPLPPPPQRITCFIFKFFVYM